MKNKARLPFHARQCYFGISSKQNVHCKITTVAFGGLTQKCTQCIHTHFFTVNAINNHYASFVVCPNSSNWENSWGGKYLLGGISQGLFPCMNPWITSPLDTARKAMLVNMFQKYARVNSSGHLEHSPHAFGKDWIMLLNREEV